MTSPCTSRKYAGLLPGQPNKGQLLFQFHEGQLRRHGVLARIELQLERLTGTGDPHLNRPGGAFELVGHVSPRDVFALFNNQRALVLA